MSLSRMLALVMLVLATMTRDGAGKEVPYNHEGGALDNEDVEGEEVKERRINFSPLPLCAMEVQQIHIEGEDDEGDIEYSPSTYREVRCKNEGGTGVSGQDCTLPFEKPFPPPSGWGSTTCLQRWDTVVIFRRQAGLGERWQKYEERQVPSGCECVILTPEIEDAEEGDGPRGSHQGARMLPVAVQRFAKSNRYGRSISIEI